MGWWRSPPPTVPTDEVVQANFFDDTPMVNAVVIRWMVRLDDVLDAQKLHAALAKLLERSDWRRLGGRLRLNKNRKLEIHVPQTFDAARPAVRFAHVSLDTEISKHPLAALLPCTTERASIQEGGDVFRELGVQAGKKLPQTLDDYYYSDEPQLALQVVSFKDATLVTLNFPHTMTDAVGLSALITNWCRVLAGKDDEVLPLVAEDPMKQLGVAEDEKGKEEHVLHSKRVAGFGFFLFVMHFIFDLVFGPKMQTRMIFLPKHAFQTMRQRAEDEIPAAEGAAATKPFISDGDILTAWGTRMVALSLGPKSKRTLLVMNVFELRGRLESIFSSSTAYVQNAFFVLSNILNAQEVQALPVGQLALRLRSALQEQTTETQIRALVREQRAALASSGQPALFGESNSMLMPFSNWSKARFFDVVDFTPAVVRAGQGKRVGKPVFFHSCDANPKPNPTHRNVFNVLGKDPEGNYWVTGMLSPATWSQVENDLQKL